VVGDSAILAGQRHNVARITDLLEEEVARGSDGTAALPMKATHLLADLRREAERLLPDIRCFMSRAEALIGLAEETS
jgi:hypothetical protein